MRRGVIREKIAKRPLVGMAMGKSLRKLFCDEGLAFKQVSPLPVVPFKVH